MESRAFPAYTYDPSAGPNWASRFHLDANSQLEADWPVQDFSYEDEKHQRVRTHLGVHLRRFRRLRPAPRRPLCPGAAREMERENDPGRRVPAPRRQGGAGRGALHHAGGRGQRPAARHRRRPPDARSAALPGVVAQPAGTRRHSQLARGKAAREKPGKNRQQKPAATPAAASRTSAPPAAPAAAPEPEEKKSPDEAYIETARCTTCNECTQINDKMFAYNENKQAYIANPDAGTYAQLVEAAESCQVSIIHPGKPRNPAEPGICRPSQARGSLRLARSARPRFSPPLRRTSAASRARRPRSPDCRPWCWQSRIAG